MNKRRQKPRETAPTRTEQTWQAFATKAAILAGGIAAGAVILGYVGRVADSGPLPLAGRIEVEEVDGELQKTRDELSKSLEDILDNLKNLSVQQQATTSELERRNIRGLQTALETAKLKARQSKTLEDELIVDALESQLAKALDDFQPDLK